jgi:hypothetical protein
MSPTENTKGEPKNQHSFFVARIEQISNFIDHYYLLVNLHDSLKEYGCI